MNGGRQMKETVESKIKRTLKKAKGILDSGVV